MDTTHMTRCARYSIWSETYERYTRVHVDENVLGLENDLVYDY